MMPIPVRNAAAPPVIFLHPSVSSRFDAADKLLREGRIGCRRGLMLLGVKASQAAAVKTRNAARLNAGMAIEIDDVVGGW